MNVFYKQQIQPRYQAQPQQYPPPQPLYRDYYTKADIEAMQMPVSIDSALSAW